MISDTRPDLEKTDLKKLLSSLGDDPFLFEGESPGVQTASTGSDSIFSIGPPPAGRGGQSCSAPKKEEVIKPPANHEERVQGPSGDSIPRIKDAVLTALIQDETLSAEQLSILFPKLKDLPAGIPPWRLALALPGISIDRILDTVARIYQIPTVDLTRISAYMLQTTWVSLPKNFKQQCETLWVLPYAYELHDRDRLTLKLACCDPIRPEVISFLRSMKTEIRLFYAHSTMLSQVFQRLVGEG